MYVPRPWTEDGQRCASAGIPADVGFATVPAPAAEMIAPHPGLRRPGALGGRRRGLRGNPTLRTELEQREVGYVLAVACDHRSPRSEERAAALVTEMPRRAWQRLSAGTGANGHRFYDRAVVYIADDRPGHNQVLVRRNRRTGELAFCRCYSSTAVPLSTLVGVVGRRWTVEETFQSGKGLTGLDEHQVRRWTSWHRWVTLAMLAHAFLAVATADALTGTHQTD
ncbi:IS701 family transposase [Streptomyces sp. DT203]|uniref:IS701 family transposase n=1 Tax=Streptomyces sp. DT203 TaxID=3393424 RepID=UPI003CF33D03